MNLDLRKLRKELHKNAELSGKEEKTSRIIYKQLLKFKPDNIITNIGGYGIAAIFDSNIPGSAIAIRADFDALPIQESNEFDHKSKTQGVSHKCGHDGHTAILLGLAEILGNNKPVKGKVILIFQPEEETGSGAKNFIADPKFKNLNIDYVFALHNLPGFPLKSIIIKENTFSSASKGLIIKLKGKTSHAAYPEDGISPDMAVCEIISEFNKLSNNESIFDDISIITIIYMRIGEIAFGTTPSDAEIMATLRSYSNTNMQLLCDNCLQIIDRISKKEKLEYSIEWTEEFPATNNNKDAVNILTKVCTDNNIKTIQLEEPFRWSEDFAHFTNKYKGALFGIGAGENHPQLHNPDYDFPDEIIETAIETFHGIIQTVLS